MSLFSAFVKGIRDAASRPRIIAILWLLNAVFASVAYVLFSSLFVSALGRSGLGAGLMSKPDMNVFFEALTTSGRPLGVMLSGIFALVLLYFLASIFFQGGILGGLLDVSGGAATGRVFFAGGAAYYGRFLRLAVYSLVLWLPAVAFYLAVDGILSGLTKGSTNEPLMFDLTLVRVALAVFLIFLIKMIMDYARIRIAAQDARRVMASLAGSVRFVFRRPVLTLGLYYLLGLTGWTAFAVWRLAHAALPLTTLGGVWAAFVLAQVFIASRGWLAIAYQSAQLTNFRSHT
jgi:hypothetical protein